MQIGDAQKLALETGIDVVADFRSADMKAGGEGAPLAPIYHHALVRKARLDLPLAIVNIGGVANITFIDEDELIAFDTGPGNGLMDEWMERHLGQAYDEGGRIAMKGKVSEASLLFYLRDDFFSKAPPKSLDRYDFNLEPILGLSIEDGMASLVEFTARAIIKARDHLPSDPKCWIICGGGRHNHFLVRRLSALAPKPVIIAEKMGWLGDMIEAQCFAFLAIRSLRGLALSFPSTTGCAKPMSGGVLFKAR